LETHDHEIHLLTDRLEQEHLRQQLAIRDKLAAKKKRKMDELKRKQDIEMTKEWLTQKKELDEVKLAKVSLSYKIIPCYFFTFIALIACKCQRVYFVIW